MIPYHFWAFIVCVLVMITCPSTAGEAPLSDREKREHIQKMYLKYKKRFPQVEDISADRARQLSEKQGVVFIDVRKPAERTVSVIAEAITDQMFKKNPSIFEGKTAVAYCTIGYRSGIFAEEMAGKGISVINLAGGILAWAHAGGKIHNAHGQTQRIHVFGKTWDYAPFGYETVVFGVFEKILNLK